VINIHTFPPHFRLFPLFKAAQKKMNIGLIMPLASGQ